MNRAVFRLCAGAAVACAVTLAGCDTTKSVLEGGTSLTATVPNPATTVDIYRVKNAYAAADQLAANYRKYCWARPYATLVADPIAKPVCENRRAVVRTIQGARSKASSAIAKADQFIRDNPRLSAVSLVNAAWSAVTGFTSAVPAVQ